MSLATRGEMRHRVLSTFVGLVLLWLALLPATTAPAQDRPSPPLSLTSADQAWIEAHPVVHVRISRSYPPFEFFADGRFQGLAVDYLQLLGDRLGLTFQPVSDMPWPEALDRVRERNGVDLILLITRSGARESFLNFTRDYISFPEVIFTRKDRLFVSGLQDLAGRKVVTENGFISATQIRQNVPGVGLFEVDTTEQALQEVALGKADAYIGNLAVGSYLIDKLGLVDLKIAAPTDYGDDSYAMGVRKDWPQLVGILEKGLDALTADDHQSLKKKWFVIPFEHGLQVRDIVQWVMLALLAAAMILILIMRRAGKILRKSEERFRAVVEDQTEFIVRWLPDGTRTFVNDSYCRRFGKSRKELLGESFFPVIRREDWGDFQARIATIRPEQPIVRGEHMVMLPDGSAGWHEWSHRGIFDARGKLVEYQSVGRDITRKRLAEQKLKENEEYFRTLTQAGPDTIALVRSADGTVLDVNDAGLERFGYGREDLLTPQSTVQLGLWKDLAKRETFLQRLVAEGKIDNFEAELLIRNGSGFFGLISARNIDIKGEACHIAYIKDISEQKRAEQQLRESETRFRELFEANPDFLVLIDLDTTRVIDCNETSQRLFRLSREEVVGQTVADLQIWQDESVRQRFLQCLREEGRVQNFHAMFRAADGTCFHGLISGQIVILNGRYCYISVLRDISALKESEESLRLSEARYRRLSQEFEAVLDGIADSMVLFNPERAVVWANRGAANQFYSDPESLTGQSCLQLWRCEGAVSCDVCIDQVFETGESFESVRKTADGRTWGVKGYPVKDAEGRVVNVIQVSSDLSEKLQLREEATRAAHLAALGGLSAGIAHEINNPTGLVLMSMPMIREAFEDILPLLDDYAARQPELAIAGLPYRMFRANVLETVDDIYGGAQRIKRIVDDLKDFAREKPGREDEDVDLGEVVERASRLLHNLIKNSTDHFRIERPESLPPVRGNSQRLEQVVVNLLHNACQAIASRQAAVTMRLSHLENEGKVLLEVADEGCGISPELLDKVTDPFFTTKRESGGTGLGLSVSSRIISEHGGSLEIHSEPDKGTTFRVKLPLPAGGEHG